MPDAKPSIPNAPATEQPGLAAAPAPAGKTHLSFLYLLKNLVSIMGLVGMAFSGLLLLFLVGLEIAGVFREESLYSGLITYIIVPGVFTASTVFTAFGMLWKWRRTRKLGVETAIVPGHTRLGRFAAISAAIVVTVGFMAVVGFGTYKGYHYTDSTTFCGLACHQVMEPEWTAYKQSVHARVNCVECHIGPGAGFFVKAKFSGLKQVWAVARGTYKTPIRTPLHSLRPAQDTCEHCHWPGRFSGSVERIFTHYAADDANTPTRYNLLIKVGGGNAEVAVPGGVHWHVSDDWEVKYLALDEKRQEIPYVRVTYKDGRMDEFASPDFDRSTLDEAALRTMDCLDCHSRPAHTFKSPNRALDEAMDKGLISPTLPGIKRAAMKVFAQDYKTKAEAMTAIDATLDAYTKAQTLTPAQQQLMPQARQQLKRVYSLNFFPEHGVDHRAFINNLGHFEYKGCERCHDGKHNSLNGTTTITKKCEACHQIIGQASGVKEVAAMQYSTKEFEHPDDPVNPKKTCSSCHALDKKEEAK
jgi:nitrate/TMAO reductase-like tetraheme cytochrome c subunit